jgi:uncharacterized protein YbjT (DUF2867 family)
MRAQSVLLVGATGLVGGACLNALIADDRFTRVALLARRPLEITAAKVEVHLVDFKNLQAHASLMAVDTVFCALGTTIKTAGSREKFREVDYDYPLEIAQIARGQGASRFLLVSSNGADAGSAIFYSKVKGEIEQAIAALNYPHYDIFRPSLLLGNRAEFRPGEAVGKIIGGALSFLIPARYKPIHAKTVAAAMVAVASRPGAGQVIHESDQIRELGSTQA